MRRVRLQRVNDSVHGTLGVLSAPGLDALHTIEPPWRENRRNRSCIPAGAYEVVPHQSPRFGSCLLVTHVPGRSHVLFHSGNVGGDVEAGFRTHTLGCILPGIHRGELKIKGRRQKAVLSSRAAFRALMRWADGRPFQLEISHA